MIYGRIYKILINLTDIWTLYRKSVINSTKDRKKLSKNLLID